MKATTLLKNDHAAVKKLFADFSRTTARAPRRRQELIDKIAQELEIHSTIEEELFYLTVKNLRGGQSLVNEAEFEHKKVDALVAEAQGMSMETDEVVQKVKELRDAIVHHATEEEREMFPIAEAGLGKGLEELGEQPSESKTRDQEGAAEDRLSQGLFSTEFAKPSGVRAFGGRDEARRKLEIAARELRPEASELCRGAYMGEAGPVAK